MEELQELYKWYQSQTPKTAVYDPNVELWYLSVGFNAELGEFGNATDREKAIDELGDLFWFTAQLANFLNVSLFALRNSPVGLTHEGHEWSPPAGDSFAIAVHAQETMDWHDKVAKHARDGRDIYEESCLFLTRTVLTLEAVAEQINIPIADLLQGNIAKLQSRQQRGVLQGSGDNR